MAKRVVVIGGGFAGSFIAKQLTKHSDLFDLTLVDVKEFFEHIPAVTREIVSYAVNEGNMDSDIPSTVLEHNTYLYPKGKLVVGEVIDVSSTEVTVNVTKKGLIGNDIANVVEATTIPYDYLCICTGRYYPGFVKTTATTVAERHREYKKQGDSLRNSETILVIGGGPVGVELAAEILQQYPNKEVTLISSSTSLLPTMPLRAQSMAQQYLEFCGTRLLFNQTVNTLQLPRQESFRIVNQRSYVPIHIQNMEEGNVKYATSKGFTGTAEKVFYCAAGSPKTNFMLKNFFSELDDDFKLKVNDYLQLESYPNIFAAGDITHFKEEKLAERALKQAEVVVENLLNVAKGLLPKTRYYVQPKAGLQVISLGTATGTLSMWGDVVSSGRVAASSKEAFLAYHCASLLSNSHMLPSTPSATSLVVNSFTISQKVSNCSNRIAVFGQGGLSTEVVKYLARYGTMSVVIVPLGTLVRLSKKIKMKGVQIMEWDSNDALLTLLQGIDTVLLTCTIGSSMVSDCVSLIHACKAAKVKHIVKCTQGAIDADTGLYDLADWNKQIEDVLRNSGVSYVIVRHAHFFTTLRIFTELYVRLYRIMAWPLGKKKVGWIDMQDVVLALCAVLVDPQAHKSQTYTLTGAAWLSAEDIRRELSSAVNENIQLVRNSTDYIYHQLLDLGLPSSLASSIVQTHTHEGSDRSPTSDFLSLTGQLPTPIHVWIRANLPRFSNASSRSPPSNPISPRSVIPPARQSTPSAPIRAAKPSHALEFISKSSNKSSFRADLAPLAALEKLESIEVVDQASESSSDSKSNTDSDSFLYSGDFQAMMDLRSSQGGIKSQQALNISSEYDKIEVTAAPSHFLGTTAPSSSEGKIDIYSSVPPYKMAHYLPTGDSDEDKPPVRVANRLPRSRQASAQDVLKPSSSEPSIRPPPERLPSNSKGINTVGSIAELHAAVNGGSISPKISQSQSLPPTVYIPIDSIPRSHSIADGIAGIAGWRPNPDPQVYLGNVKNGLLSHPTQPIQNIPLPPLVDMGFFDMLFRDAFKEHLIATDKAKLCPFVDLIIDITKFKCIFEGDLPVPSKFTITADTYKLVNQRTKKKRTAKARGLQESLDKRFQEAKSRAMKIMAKYCATTSRHHIVFSAKFREKINRPIINRIAQSHFDKILTFAWATLVAEIPSFMPSIERMCFEEQRVLTHDILRIEHKLMDVDTSMTNKKSELQILEQQKRTLANLHSAKLMAAKRCRPKATFLCGFENFSTMNRYWEALSPKILNYIIPNDLICFLKGDPLNETEQRFSDIACGRLASSYPAIPEMKTRLGDPICDTFRLYLTYAYGIILMADGCNWGRMPCEAARNASDQMVEYIRENIITVHNLQRLGQLMMQSIEAAHQAVLATSKYKLNMLAPSETEVWDVGTTTILAGVIVQIENGGLELVCISVGDCKMFIYRNGKVIDVTSGNRGNLTDARDPGGRLGPQLRLGRPDLRNLSLVSYSLLEDDLVFAVTDGVHDNFDPQQVGVMPRTFGIEADDWSTAESSFPVVAAKQKADYMTNKMQEVISTFAAGAKVEPNIISRALTQYSLDLSKGSREWMETHPGKKLPEDYVQFPGKMDHATCICTRANYKSNLMKLSK